MATYDLEPTRVRAVMVAELKPRDWSWQPAREGRIRSGTASVKPSGVAKLRAGAVWVDPEYLATHRALAAQAQLNLLRAELPELVLAELRTSAEPLSLDDLTESIVQGRALDAAVVRPRVTAVLRNLQCEGRIQPVAGSRDALAA